MEIRKRNNNLEEIIITIRELVDGYIDNGEDGVVAFGGRLDVRPPYQREFVYPDKLRNAVIHSVRKGRPINTFHWAKNGDRYEIVDGQQRTISICEYLKEKGSYSIKDQYFHGLTKEQQEDILNYEMTVFVFDGTEKEKLEWFDTLNTGSMVLTEQEKTNKVYLGPWLIESKKHFSKTNCAAYNIGQNYLTGSPIRQEYFETVLEWIADNQKLSGLKAYMALHQFDTNCIELWSYYQSVINWIENLFPPKTQIKKLMKGLPWGIYYNKYGKNNYDPKYFEKRIKELIEDNEVLYQKGIIEYLLSYESNESLLRLRLFSDKDKMSQYTKQNGMCPICGKQYKIEEMEGDHIIPWKDHGATTLDNLQMLCKKCNRTKGGK